MRVNQVTPADPATFGQGLKGRELDELAVNTIRGLAMDAVQKAKAGHPGMPMGMADAAYVLWTKFLRITPTDPRWPDRDRFVLSAGHGSMLLYSLLHLMGFEITLEDIKQFRQWGSRTPGHPELDPEVCVETTTGPLGQGFANGVGMALAERMLAAQFSVDGEPIVDHYTYGIVSDGDLMEGIASEAASLAGHLGLGRLIYLYDDNHISIEGDTELAFTEDVQGRFEAYHWHVQRVNGHDREAVEQAIEAALRETTRPSLVICRTHIAKGSPNKQDTAAAHGEPLGEEEVRLTKQALGLPLEPTFFVPQVVRDVFAGRRAEVDRAYAEWQQRFARWREKHPDLAARWEAQMSRALPAGLAEKLPQYQAGKEIATRNASGEALQVLSAEMPALVGGSADLAPSTKTLIAKEKRVARGCYQGRNLHFGVREHAMGGLLNGLALHGGFIPYGGTFLVFADYMRPSIRLAAFMRQQVIYVFTHDSVFVGEDGPTHEPVEQLMSLRAIPHLTVIRPADASETTVAWLVALERRQGPTALILTRQNIPVLDRASLAPAEMLRWGGYVLLDAPEPEMVILASGSEVHLGVEAARMLAQEGRRIRVVNLASWEIFEEQPEGYRLTVLPPSVPLRLCIEAGVTLGWSRYLGDRGLSHGIDEFGHSAPWKVIAQHLGFTAEAVAAKAREMLAGVESAG
jgi:transketolase